MAKTKRCRIVGAAAFRIGQPIEHAATTSATATIDMQPYVSEGSVTFTNDNVENTGQNVKKSGQYGQDGCSISFTFFAVDDDDPNNPLTILRIAQAQHKAVPVYYKESEAANADGFDGDVVVSADELPIPGTGEIKVTVQMQPNNDYRVWKRLVEDLAVVE